MLFRFWQKSGELHNQAKNFLDACQTKHITVFLPEDITIANQFSNTASKKIVSISQGIPSGWQGMDIGPLTLHHWQKELMKAGTVFWNGPVGVFEFPSFSNGTNGLASTLASLNAHTVVGGGDSVSAITHLGLANRFTHLSTGGGASLEFLEFGKLPGIEALRDY